MNGILEVSDRLAMNGESIEEYASVYTNKEVEIDDKGDVWSGVWWDRQTKAKFIRWVRSQ